MLICIHRQIHHGHIDSFYKVYLKNVNKNFPSSKIGGNGDKNKGEKILTLKKKKISQKDKIIFGVKLQLVKHSSRGTESFKVAHFRVQK